MYGVRACTDRSLHKVKSVVLTATAVEGMLNQIMVMCEGMPKQMFAKVFLNAMRDSCLFKDASGKPVDQNMHGHSRGQGDNEAVRKVQVEKDTHTFKAT